MVAQVAVTPLGLTLTAAGVGLLAWASADLWRNRAYSTSNKIGWQLVMGGLTVGLVSLGDGWFIGFPLGTLAYVLLAAHGPVRRASAPTPAAEVDGTETPETGRPPPGPGAR